MALPQRDASLQPSGLQYTSSQGIGYLAAILASLLYGGNVIAGRVLAPLLPPLAMSAARSTLGLLILLPLVWREPNKPGLKDFPHMALLGFLGITVAYGTFAWSMQTNPAANAAIIIATTPAFTHFFLAVGWRIKPSGYQILGLVLAFTGLALVFTHGSLRRLLLLHFQPADLVLLLNVISVSLFNITGQRVMMKGYSPTITSAYTLIFGTFFLLPGSVWEIARQGWYLSPSGWVLLIYMGCFIAGIAVLLNLLAVSRIGCGVAAMFSNLNPLFAIALSALILNERLYWYHAISAIMVIAGVTLSLLPQSPYRTVPAHSSNK